LDACGQLKAAEPPEPELTGPVPAMIFVENVYGVVEDSEQFVPQKHEAKFGPEHQVESDRYS